MIIGSIEGQLAGRYFWGVPLNYKNVLCIWAFIVIVGGTVFEIVYCIGRKGNMTAV